MSESVPIPPGVEPRCVIDLDHHSRAFNEDEVAITSELRATCPVAWNTRYGGFWFATGYGAVSQIGRDYETFAHRYERHAPDGIDYYGEQGIPRRDEIPAMGIGEVDGNYHFELRRALNPFFNPQSVAELRPFSEACVNWFVDQKIESGSMDLVLDLSSPVPALLTMKMMGLPYDDWAIWSDAFHTTIAYPVGHPEQVRASARLPEMIGKLMAFAAERRANPSDDLTSFLMQLEIEGRRLNDEQVLRILTNLIGGGVDTTTSLTALTLHLLAAQPELRRRLIDDPGLYATATDEFLRYTTVNQLLSRTVTKDVEVDGHQLRRNDRVLISWIGANHDEHEFDRPGDIVLDRAPNRHLAFGLGPHRCIGSHLAKMMFEVIVRCVLDRLPDYEIDEAAVERYGGHPAMTGLIKLPARFSPGAVVGAVMPSEPDPSP
jgi:cytochrome P450